MSLEFLSAGTRSTLEEIARMAYGSGWLEGTRGGKGRIGMLSEDGRIRVIKYNTHVLDRGPFGESKSRAMIDSSVRLRSFLWDVAQRANLSKPVLAAVQEQLEMNLANRPAKSLLSRKVVADVLQKIGGDQIWEDARRGVDIGTYSSKNLSTSFSKVVETGAAADTAASRAVQGRMSEQDCRAAVVAEWNLLCVFCSKMGIPQETLDAWKDIHYRVLNPNGDVSRAFDGATEQDVRSAVIKTTARLLRLMSADRGLTLSREYLSYRKGDLGVLQNEVGAVHRELIGDHDDFFKELGARRLADGETYGDAFTINFLRTLFANDLAPQPLDLDEDERHLSRWEVIKPEDLPRGGGSIERAALMKALMKHCGNQTAFLSALFGNELKLKHLAKLGVTRQKLEQVVNGRIANHRFQDRVGAPGTYFRMVGKWLADKLEKSNPGDPAALRESILQRLRDCAPLCAVNGTESLQKDELLADLQRELEHPVYAGEVKNLTGSIELGGELIPLWTKAEGYEDIYGEKIGGVEENLENEHELMKEVIAGRLLEFCGTNENDPLYLTMLKCCTGASRTLFGLFCGGSGEKDLACHREFWKEGGKIHFRISANVDGEMCAAHYEIDANGQMTLLRIPMDPGFPSVSQAGDEQGQHVDRQTADELEQVHRRIRKLESGMAEFEGKVSLPTKDLDKLSDPFAQKESEPLSPKEQCAAEIVTQSVSKPKHAMLCYNDIRAVGKKQPNEVGSEAELRNVQRDFEIWLGEKEAEGKILGQDQQWAWFKFAGKLQGDERSQQIGEPSVKRHKLYLTVPNNRIRQMKQEDFESIYKALNDLSGSFSNPCSFKISKTVYSAEGEDWTRSTDQICGYFDSEEDLKLAEEALKDLNKRGGCDYMIEHGTDVEIGPSDGVFGRDMYGNQQCLSTISHTGILSLRAWVAGCIKTRQTPRALKTEFKAAVLFLRKFDAGTLSKDDRLLVAYLHRFLFVRYGLPVTLVKGAEKPTPRMFNRGTYV